MTADLGHAAHSFHPLPTPAPPAAHCVEAIDMPHFLALSRMLEIGCSTLLTRPWQEKYIETATVMASAAERSTASSTQALEIGQPTKVSSSSVAAEGLSTLIHPKFLSLSATTTFKLDPPTSLAVEEAQYQTPEPETWTCTFASTTRSTVSFTTKMVISTDSPSLSSIETHNSSSIILDLSPSATLSASLPRYTTTTIPNEVPVQTNHSSTLSSSASSETDDMEGSNGGGAGPVAVYVILGVFATFGIICALVTNQKLVTWIRGFIQRIREARIRRTMAS